MARQVAPKHPTPEFMGLKSVGLIILTVGLPAALTLRTARVPRPMMPLKQDPTPLGYTWSLGLFLFPVAVMTLWFFLHPDQRFQKKAFARTLAFLIPTGIVLDLIWGCTFFQFINEHAVLGLWIPARGGRVPIEEFIFYGAGFVAVLMAYIWCDEYWLGMYNIDRDGYRDRAHQIPKVVQFYWQAPAVGLVLGLAACLYKWYASDYPTGWPGYAFFLIGVALVPTMWLYRTAEPFINWRALSFTYFLLLLISLLWEATVAVPYQWWGYRDGAMLGIFIDAWSRLPIEAAILWSVVTFTTIIWYEAVKVFLAMEQRTTRKALFGGGPARPEHSEAPEVMAGA